MTGKIGRLEQVHRYVNNHLIYFTFYKHVNIGTSVELETIDSEKYATLFIPDDESFFGVKTEHILSDNKNYDVKCETLDEALRKLVWFDIGD